MEKRLFEGRAPNPALFFCPALIAPERRSAAYEMWKSGNSVDDCMKTTGHKTASMFKRYADLFSTEEERARQREVQDRRREWRKAQTANVVVTSKGVVQ